METETNQTRTNWLGQLWASVAATVVLCVICCGIYPLIVWAVAQGVFPHQANGSLLKKDGTPTTDDKQAAGSVLIGQNFSNPEYFHPRPSAAGNGYDATSSGGSNLGPLSDKLLNGAPAAPSTQPTTQPVTPQYDGIRLRTLHYAVDNGLTFKLVQAGAEVPLKKFQDASGNPNDEALVEAFPHTGGDGLIATDFRKPDGTSLLIPADAVTASASGLDPHISAANADLQAARIAAARKVTVQQVTALIEQYTDRPTLGILGDRGVNVLRLNIAMDTHFPVSPK